MVVLLVQPLFLRARPRLLRGSGSRSSSVGGGGGAAGGARGGDHVGVLLDAELGHDEDVAVGGGLVPMGAPGEEVPPDLDVVVRELAVLVVVHAEQLCLLGGAELQAGGQVDELGDGGGGGEGVGGGGDDGGELPAEDGVVAVEEAAAGAGVDAVEADDGARGEEAVEDEADDAADAVLGEDVEGVVDADEELD